MRKKKLRFESGGQFSVKFYEKRITLEILFDNHRNVKLIKKTTSQNVFKITCCRLSFLKEVFLAAKNYIHEHLI